MYLLYFALWMIYFGSITLESVLFGVAIAAAMFAFTCVFLDYSIAKEINLYRMVPQILRFIGTLVLEILKANAAVIQMILTEKTDPEPVLVHFHSDLETPTARAFMANSITLTPGTITVTLEDSEYVVHCLDESLAEGLDTSACARELAQMESGYVSKTK